jgi:3-isopropylmalate/(R)-2-methylmalate dehydratase large subunit
MTSGRTLLDKIWDRHVVDRRAGEPDLLYVDLHLVHEVTSPQAFAGLAHSGRRVRRPDLHLATVDHAVPTRDRALPWADAQAVAQVEALRANATRAGIPVFDISDAAQGIVHVVAPDLGLSQPGTIIVCGDSHTSTHGAFGALAFGIGTSEVEHVLATQTIARVKPRQIAVELDGITGPTVSAKDVILATIAAIGTAGGAGAILEYRGSWIRSLSMEGRMTVCNMSIEAGARAGMVAPDETTFAYLQGRPRAPHGVAWERATADWRTLHTDAGAAFDRVVALDAAAVEPMITYGTNPGMVAPISGWVPERPGDAVFARALQYMGLTPGEGLRDKPVQVVFVGSCTNARISDLEIAAQVLAGRKVAPGVRMLVVPGSQQVKHEAEARGLAKVFTDAGAEWRESGCSMCLGMNGDTVPQGQYCVSTSNRNFEGRQGSGARTLLASPATAAATAVRGRVTDPREFLN